MGYPPLQVLYSHWSVDVIELDYLQYRVSKSTSDKLHENRNKITSSNKHTKGIPQIPVKSDAHQKHQSRYPLPSRESIVTGSKTPLECNSSTARHSSKSCAPGHLVLGDFCPDFAFDVFRVAFCFARFFCSRDLFFVFTVLHLHVGYRG